MEPSNHASPRFWLCYLQDTDYAVRLRSAQERAIKGLLRGRKVAKRMP